MQTSAINYLWRVKSLMLVLDKWYAYIYDLKSVQSFDLFTLYTTLPHNLFETKTHTSFKCEFKTSECENIRFNSLNIR